MSRQLIISSLLILGSAAAVACAQPTSFQGPISGFVYNHGSRTIRPLLGIPGAARIGAPILNEVDFASIAPNGKWAFLTKGGQSSLVQGLTDTAPANLPADGLIDAVDRAVWNRDGSYVLLYSSSGNRLQRVRIADSGAVPDSPMDLSAWGTATTLAIDPAGRQIAFGIAGSGLYLFQAGQTPALLSSMTQPSVAAFDGAGKRLYAVDLDRQSIWAFDSGASALELVTLAPADAPGITPVGLAVSGDGRSLLLAVSSARAIQVYDSTSGSLANTIPLDFTPSRFEALSPAPTFLLNGDNTSEWLLVLDARQLPGVSFVPANQEVAQ